MRRRTERKQIAAGLRKVPLFADCTDRELFQIDRLMTELAAAPGRTLMGRGTAALQFIIVREGYGRVSANGQDIGRVGPGSYIGEHTFRGQPWNATITALTPMTVFVLNASELAAVLRDIPALRERIVAGEPARQPEPRPVARPELAHI